ncbi:hypothetical protein PR003_g33040 [Phytophthora rubi]|uniref:Uncharacterized protein n=1 Tax=Phytophthora rubi TaxID=129364 RepID=A0A6A4AYB2_9STRA|nr:hypothetical protein PR003_g33040 [Phytophthora rubi]
MRPSTASKRLTASLETTATTVTISPTKTQMTAWTTRCRISEKRRAPSPVIVMLGVETLVMMVVETPVGVMTPVVAMTMVDMLTLSMLTVEALALMMVEMLTVEALAMLTVESQILLMLVALWEMLRMRMTQVTSLKENQLRLLLATTTCCTMSVLQVRPLQVLCC